ncbi:MAG: VCBS repeat-containing protein [Bifidobacteriaceae bacterium]|nr:VCBS repeat-containing protein [Bifidobacteriaceae bacterium]
MRRLLGARFVLAAVVAVGLGLAVGVPAALSVESGGAGGSVAGGDPVRPVGAIRNIVLAQSVFSTDYGAVLGIDEAGDLWAYPSRRDGRLGLPTRLGTGYGGSRLYPADGWLRLGESTYNLWSVTAGGDLRRDSIRYKDTVDPSQGRIGWGWSPYGVTAAGDVNGDGRRLIGYSDILAIDQATGDLYLYRQTGEASTFRAKLKVGNGWLGWRLLAAGDVDGDRRQDVFGVSPTGDLYLFRGRGGGYFHTKTKVGNGWSSFDIASGADLDGDRRGDLVGRDGKGDLYFYKGKGGGRFASKVKVGNGWGPTGGEPDPAVTGAGHTLPLPWHRPTWVAFGIGAN